MTATLSPREFEVLRLAATGLTNRGVAGALGISTATVKNHMTAVCAKLDVGGRYCGVPRRRVAAGSEAAVVTPQAIFNALGRPAMVAAPCAICHGGSGHPAIDGDGEPVCYACILRCGREVSDPLSATTARLVQLSEAHSEVVELRPNAERPGAHWAWIAGWPVAGASA